MIELLDRLGTSARLAPAVLMEARFPFRSPEAIERAQSRRVSAITRYAYENVPHYRESMIRLGLRPEDLRTAQDLCRLPLVERGQIQREPGRFASRAIAGAVHLRSSGTTGAPITVSWDRAAVIARAVHDERRRAIASVFVGRRFGWRETAVVLGAGQRPTGPLNDARRTMAWLPKRLIAKRQLLPVLEGPAMTIRRIREFEPEVVGAFGSYLEALFAELERRGESLPSVRVAQFGGDAIGEPARATIEKRFRIPVVGGYGSIETLDIGFECEHHLGYHVNVDLCPIRIVDRDGREVRDGERGEVVVSNLLNRATVLLNYRLGDTAARLTDPCPCGRTLPLISTPHGREDDWLELEGGRRIHPLALRGCVKDDPDIWQFRFLQSSHDRLETVVVPAAGVEWGALRERIATKLGERLGPSVTVDVRAVERVPTDPSGKRREVVSYVKGEPDRAR